MKQTLNIRRQLAVTLRYSRIRL